MLFTLFPALRSLTVDILLNKIDPQSVEGRRLGMLREATQQIIRASEITVHPATLVEAGLMDQAPVADVTAFVNDTFPGCAGYPWQSLAQR